MWLQLKKKKKKFTVGNARKPAFIYLRRVVIHLSTRPYDAMYREREGKSKLKPFYRLFRELFFAIFVWPQA